MTQYGLQFTYSEIASVLYSYDVRVLTTINIKIKFK